MIQAEEIKALASREERSAAQMVRILLKEALEARQGKVSLTQKLRDSFGDWPTSDLQAIGQLILKILGDRILSSGQVEHFKISDFAQQVSKYWNDCIEAWNAMPGGLQRLAEISEGAKPTEDEMIILKACLPIANEKIDELTEEAFSQNETTHDHQNCHGSCS